MLFANWMFDNVKNIMQRLNQESLRFKANPVEDQVEDGWQQIMKMMNKHGGNMKWRFID